jgi:hypothetical protein
MENLCHIDPMLRKSEEHLSHCSPSPLARKVAPESHIKRSSVPFRHLPRSRTAVHNHSHRKSTGARFMSSLPGSPAESHASSAHPAPNRSIKRTCLRQAAYVRR